MDYPSGLRHNVDFRAPTSTHGARTGSQEERARPGRREVARKRVGEKNKQTWKMLYNQCAHGCKFWFNITGNYRKKIEPKIWWSCNYFRNRKINKYNLFNRWSDAGSTLKNTCWNFHITALAERVEQGRWKWKIVKKSECKMWELIYRNVTDENGMK